VPRHSSPLGRGQPSVSEAGEGFFNPNLEFIRPSSPFASFGYFSQREKNVWLPEGDECVALPPGCCSAYAGGVFWTRAHTTDLHRREGAADQPRPAFGRRPWLALLRRARSLRLFALAIGRKRLAASTTLVAVVAGDGSWHASPVAAATTANQRRLGVMTGSPMVLIRTRNVHSRGLTHGLRLVGIDQSGAVVEVRALAPGRFARIAGATWVLEQPLDAPQPRVGTRLAIYAHPDDRTTAAVCHPDRQPR